MEPSALEALMARAIEAEAFLFRDEEERERPLPYRLEGDAALIEISGALVAKSSFFARLFGITSYEDLLGALAQAEGDPRAERIILRVDSPGGAVTGVQGVVNAVNQLKKPCSAEVIGTCASAAYWIACAAEEISAVPTARIGSLGVVITSWAEREGSRQIRFTSSQTPNKNPDPRSDRGRDQFQQLADDLAAVFLKDVARLRGLGSSPNAAAERYGAGAVMVAARALGRGMIDEITDGDKEMGGDKEKEAQAIADLKAQLAAKTLELEAASLLKIELEKRISDASAQSEALSTENKTLSAELKTAQKALSAERKETAIEALLSSGRIAPAEKEAAEMAWDIQATSPGQHIFDKIYKSRPENSAVKLEPLGHGGDPKVDAEDKEAQVEAAKALVKEAKKQGERLTLADAITQIQAGLG